MASLSEYLNRIPQNDRNQPIDYKNVNRGQYIPKDLGKIADAMADWEGPVATALGLGDADISNIKGQYQKPNLQKREALKLWRSRRGAALSTPKDLLQAFHSAELYDYCDIVCNVLEPKSPLAIPDSESMTRTPMEVETNYEASTQPAPKLFKTETGAAARVWPQSETDSGNTDDSAAVQREDEASSTEYDPFNWCLVTGQEDLPVQSPTTAASEASPAVPRRGVKFWKKHEITVAITYKSIHYLEKWGLEVEDILDWANRWQPQEEPKYIPIFISAARIKDADIIVELNEKGRNESQLGIAGKAGSTKPTMWLDLSDNDENYKEHLVVHEFGHALGLGHEHQRSDFHACICYFLDEEKMRKKLKGRYKDWCTDVKLDIHSATEYDPESVMHYWFEKEWLKYGFDDKKNIEAYSRAGILSEKMKNALLSVHSCRFETLPTKPSTKDLKYINGVYEKIFNKPEP